MALGYEDLNDHGELRHDLALQTAASRVETLASPSTLCRLEQRTDRDTAVAIHQILFEQFIKAHDRPPKRLILDFDATDTPLHGEQEGQFFHGYYDHYCFLPLYVFCGRHQVGYIVGIAQNKRLEAKSGFWIESAQRLHELTGKKQRVFASIHYGAHSWDKPRG